MAASKCTSFCCDICGVDMPTKLSYNDHRDSFEHKLLKLLTSKSDSTTLFSPKNAHLNACDGENTFKCRVCNIYIAGAISFKDHIHGLKHEKKIRLLKNTAINYLMQCDNDCISQVGSVQCNVEVSDGAKTEEISKTKKSGKLEFNSVFPFYCEFCAKFFTGSKPYNEHLLSGAHLKKVRLTCCESQPFVGKLVCNICGDLFSGPIPYQQHTASQKHLKKARAKQLLDVIKSDARDVIKFDREEKGSEKSVSPTACDDSEVPQLPSDIRVIKADEPVKFF